MSAATFSEAEVREQLLSTIECFVDTGPLGDIDDGAGPTLNRAYRGATGEPVLRVHVQGRVYTVAVTAEDC